MMYNYPPLGFPGFRKNYPNYYRSNYYRPNLNKVHNNSDKHLSNSSNSNLNNTLNNHLYNINHNPNNTYNTNYNNFVNNNSSYDIKKEPTYSSCIQEESNTVDFSCNDNYYSDNDCFNILGLNLHIDDLLILALLFFLYKEGSEDMYLYLALFLLLLS